MRVRVEEVEEVGEVLESGGGSGGGSWLVVVVVLGLVLVLAWTLVRGDHLGGQVNPSEHAQTGGTVAGLALDDLRGHGWGARLEVLHAAPSVPPEVELTGCWQTGVRARVPKRESGNWTLLVAWRGPGSGRRGSGLLQPIRLWFGPGAGVGSEASALLTGRVWNADGSCQVVGAWRGWGG